MRRCGWAIDRSSSSGCRFHRAEFRARRGCPSGRVRWFRPAAGACCRRLGATRSRSGRSNSQCVTGLNVTTTSVLRAAMRLPVARVKARRSSASCRSTRAGRRRFPLRRRGRSPSPPGLRPRRRCSARTLSLAAPARSSAAASAAPCVLVADAVGVERARRFHRDQRQQLQHVVLDHVAQRRSRRNSLRARPRRRFPAISTSDSIQRLCHTASSSVLPKRSASRFCTGACRGSGRCGRSATRRGWPERGVDGARRIEVVADQLLQHQPRRRPQQASAVEPMERPSNRFGGVDR